VLVVVCLVASVGYVAWSGRRGELAASAVPTVAAVTGDAAAVAALNAESHLLFISTIQGADEGKVALAPLGTPGGLRTLATARCERAYYAAGRGLCLTSEPGLVTTYSAYTFGPDFQRQHSIPLAGIPSRARVSSDGRYGALTVFVSGHSYASGAFSTQTLLIDLEHGATLADLEKFTVTRNGTPFQASDFNFWGITFARDNNRFYATLGTGGKTYLVEGDVTARRARIIYENVECPSLSPNNTRVAYKKLISSGGRTIWQPTILDLATLTETPLTAETRSIDDQIEWLDDGHILYAVPQDTPASVVVADIWALPADGSGTPQLVVPQAYSPAVVR
jgi:hypothetical protein